MKILLSFFIACFICLILVYPAYAISDPLERPNNKFGIHILFREEIEEAAGLVNANGGDWGYVTIPIQAGDRDLEKWQGFMDTSSKYHIIPIIRLAIENDYFNTKVWRRPRESDILDFANFLNSLEWPTKNRYIIIFNEINRYDEWGESPSPADYAELLSYAVTTFKSKNKDFFIISAGLDNAAADVAELSYNEYTFLKEMNKAVPGIFNKIDGLGSHSYPNPGFFQSPFRKNSEGVFSFRYEKNLVKSLGGPDLPIFITETGWTRSSLADDIIAVYYKEVFESVWNSNDIVAVTPFLLRAGAGPFTDFSFINSDGTKTQEYNAVKEIVKTKGQPILSSVSLEKNETIINPSSLPTKRFSEHNSSENFRIEIPLGIKVLIRYLLKI